MKGISFFTYFDYVFFYKVTVLLQLIMIFSFLQIKIKNRQRGRFLPIEKLFSLTFEWSYHPLEGYEVLLVHLGKIFVEGF